MKKLLYQLIPRRMRWAGQSDVYRVLLGKPEGKRPLGRTRRRWEDNIKIDFQEVGCGVWSGFRAGSG